MKLRDDSFNPSRSWVFYLFVTLPVSQYFLHKLLCFIIKSSPSKRL